MQLTSGTLLERGKYRIVKTLGRGGFGITYLAEQVNLRRMVCIKEFFPKDYFKRDDNNSSISLLSDSFKENMSRFKTKFVKEAQTIADLEHPNIVAVKDVFEENNTAYYIMDYVEGESLSEMVKRRGVMCERDAVAYIKQVASALEYIHSKQIMHLDVKPANIMVRRDDNSAILIDFGLSKHYDAASGEATSTTPVGVSHGFAPIEQYKQGGVSKFSPETDIYSLGATLYYLLTGLIPPEAATLIVEPLEIPQNISSSVRTAITTAMSIAPNQRPHNIKEFMSLLGDPKQVKPLHREEVVVDEITVIGIDDDDKTRIGDTASTNKSIQPNNEIWYTSTDGEVVIPYEREAFDASIVSNTYENGRGVIRFDGDITAVKANVFSCCSNLKSIIIPNSVKSIGCAAFYKCTDLISISMPKSVTKIDAYAFEGCSSLKDIKIPGALSTISRSVFYNCKSLSKVDIPFGVTCIEDNAFGYCVKLTDVTIPSSVVTIKEGAFTECSSLFIIVMPDSVLEIGPSVFYKCTGLRSVTISKSLREISHSAFSHCRSLSIVDIPDRVQVVRSAAFLGCTRLETIVFGRDVKRIEEYSINSCSLLKQVYCKSTMPPILNDTLSTNFQGSNASKTSQSTGFFSSLFGRSSSETKVSSAYLIHVPRSAVQAYKKANWWAKYADYIVAHDF